MRRLYQSSPKSKPSVPFLSEERKVFIIPALTLFSSLLNASASSASLVSWLMKTNGLPVADGLTSPSAGVFDFSDSLIWSPNNSTLLKLNQLIIN